MDFQNLECYPSGVDEQGYMLDEKTGCYALLLELGWGEGLLDGALFRIFSVRTSDSFGTSPVVRSRGRLIARRVGLRGLAHLFVAVSNRHDVFHPLHINTKTSLAPMVLFHPSNDIIIHVERLAPRLNLPA